MKLVITKAIFFLIVFSAVAVHSFAPQLIGIETIGEQVNGTLPVGAMYSSGYQIADVIISIAAFVCVTYIGYEIYLTLEEKYHHE